RPDGCRDVEGAERGAGDRVPDGDPGAVPVVKPRTPVLGAPDDARGGGGQRGPHAVGAGPLLRPGAAGGEVRLVGQPQRGAVTPGRQDATQSIGDGDEPADAGHVVFDGLGQPGQLRQN